MRAGSLLVRAPMQRSREVLGVQLGYCEGLQCGHLWIVPIMPTPLLPSASTSNVSASFPHVLHSVTWIEPGDISAWSVSSIVTIAQIDLPVN